MVITYLSKWMDIVTSKYSLHTPFAAAEKKRSCCNDIQAEELDLFLVNLNILSCCFGLWLLAFLQGVEGVHIQGSFGHNYCNKDTPLI